MQTAASPELFAPDPMTGEPGTLARAHRAGSGPRPPPCSSITPPVRTADQRDAIHETRRRTHGRSPRAVETCV